MKKWIVYVLGVVSGIILIGAFAFFVNRSEKSEKSEKSENKGLDIFEKPGEYMDYSQFEVFQVISDGFALAHVEDVLGVNVLLIPNEEQHFYDGQRINLNEDQCAQRIGTYKYSSMLGENTIPAIKIVSGIKSVETITATINSGKTLFEKPGDCVSKKNFEIQKVLESGDAIALEIMESNSGYVFTSDLEVMLLAQDGKTFYNNQVVKVPQGKCARQIGSYKYQQYGHTKVIPIVEIK